MAICYWLLTNDSDEPIKLTELAVPVWLSWEGAGILLLEHIVLQETENKRTNHASLRGLNIHINWVHIHNIWESHPLWTVYNTVMSPWYEKTKGWILCRSHLSSFSIVSFLNSKINYRPFTGIGEGRKLCFCRILLLVIVISAFQKTLRAVRCKIQRLGRI